jgi:hypothetical protein
MAAVEPGGGGAAVVRGDRALVRGRRLDVFREPHDGDTWICRRDPGLRRPYRDVVRHTDDGVPYLAPEIVLLFKAKARRPKDEADLASLLPVLDGAQRDWLARSLTVVHPGHPWIAAVAGRGA